MSSVDARKQICQIVRRNGSNPFERGNARLSQHVERQLVGKNKEIAGVAQLSSRRVGDFVKSILDLGRILIARLPGIVQGVVVQITIDAPLALIRISAIACRGLAASPLRSVSSRPETSPTRYPTCNPRTRPRPRRARSSPPPTTSPAWSRDRACRSPRTSSVRARSAPRRKNPSSYKDAPNRRRRRGARIPRVCTLIQC